MAIKIIIPIQTMFIVPLGVNRMKARIAPHTTTKIAADDIAKFYT